MDDEIKFYNNLFEDVLKDSYTAEAAAKHVVERINSYLQSEGRELILDATSFASYVDKLTTLHVLQKLIMGLGLGHHYDQIMGNEIDRIFPNELIRPSAGSNKGGHNSRKETELG